MIEKQILKQKLQEGKSKRQIAKELNSSEPTIRKYIKEYNLDNYYSFDFSKNNQRNNFFFRNSPRSSKVRYN